MQYPNSSSTLHALVQHSSMIPLFLNFIIGSIAFAVSLGKNGYSYWLSSKSNGCRTSLYSKGFAASFTALKTNKMTDRKDACVKFLLTWFFWLAIGVVLSLAQHWEHVGQFIAAIVGFEALRVDPEHLEGRPVGQTVHANVYAWYSDDHEPTLLHLKHWMSCVNEEIVSTEN